MTVSQVIGLVLVLGVLALLGRGMRRRAARNRQELGLTGLSAWLFIGSTQIDNSHHHAGPHDYGGGGDIGGGGFDGGGGV